MDFVRSYFFTNEPLTIWTLFSSLFDWFHSKPVKMWGKKCSTGQRFICTEVTSYKIHILVDLISFRFFFLILFLLDFSMQKRMQIWNSKWISNAHSVKELLCAVCLTNNCPLGPQKRFYEFYFFLNSLKE